MEKMQPTMVYSSTQIRKILEDVKENIMTNLLLWNVGKSCRSDMEDCFDGHIALYWDEHEQKF